MRLYIASKHERKASEKKSVEEDIGGGESGMEDSESAEINFFLLSNDRFFCLLRAARTALQKICKERQLDKGSCITRANKSLNRGSEVEERIRLMTSVEQS